MATGHVSENALLIKIGNSKTLRFFSLGSTSFKDLPFLYEIRGGLKKNSQKRLVLRKMPVVD